MGDYAVTVTALLDTPVEEAASDKIYELLGDTASMAVSDTEISVTTDTLAEDPSAALSLVTHLLNSCAAEVGVQLGRIVEGEVVEWERHERRMDEPNLPDLVSAPEVGEILGVSRQRVHQLIKENRSFPPPLLRLGSGPLWLRATIEAFDRTWTRKPGRPAAQQVAAQTVRGHLKLAGSGAVGRAGAKRTQTSVEGADPR